MIGTGQDFDAIKALEEELEAAEQRVDFLKNTIAYLKQKQSQTIKVVSQGSFMMGTEVVPSKPIIINGYSVQATNKAKIMYFLKATQRFLHIRELSILANKMEPEVSVETWQKRFSPALSTLRNENKIINIKPGKSLMNTFWGSEKWLNPDGSVIKGHEYDLKYAGDDKEEIEI